MNNDEVIIQLQETIEKLKKEILDKEKIITELLEQIEQQEN